MSDHANMMVTMFLGANDAPEEVRAALDALVAALERGDSLLDQCGREHAAMFVRVEAAEAERDEARRAAKKYEGAMNAQLGLRSAAEARVTMLEAALAGKGTCADTNCSMADGHPGSHYDVRDGFAW